MIKLHFNAEKKKIQRLRSNNIYPSTRVQRSFICLITGTTYNKSNMQRVENYRYESSTHINAFSLTQSVHTPFFFSIFRVCAYKILMVFDIHLLFHTITLCASRYALLLLLFFFLLLFYLFDFPRDQQWNYLYIRWFMFNIV